MADAVNNRHGRPLCSGVGKEPETVYSQPRSVWIRALGYPVHYLGRGKCPDCKRSVSFRAIDNPTNHPRAGMQPHLPSLTVTRK